MLKYIGNRILQIAILLVIYVAIVFFMLHAMPGGIKTLLISNPKLTPQAQEAIIRAFGLNQPLWLQFVDYMKNVFTLNLGISFSYYPTPVWNIIAERLPRTVLLFTVATLIAFFVGFASGKSLAWNRGKTTEYVSTVVGIITYTIFTPLLIFVMIWFFGSFLGIFPLNQFLNPDLWIHTRLNAQIVFLYILMTMVIIGAVMMVSYLMALRFSHKESTKKMIFYVSTAISIVFALFLWVVSPIGIYGADILWHMVLPVMTVTIISYAGNMLVMRDSMLETIKEDFITTARAKGLPDKVVRDKHAARTAMLPVVTNFVLSLGFVVSGGVITESLFSWPGMGMTLLDSTLAKDYPLAAGALIFTGIFVLIAHLVVDIVYAFLDPRIRY
ncbi:MAG: ABC transporter permease [Thermotogae bacterium]|nr:ABC transporter permease [Thermotogota bacterium]MCL5032836.1 ABC transporter permease [Thermotogota bacterium]